MGYTTEFDGAFVLDKPLAENHKNYLVAFANIRHMRRIPELTATYPDPIREAVGLDLGPHHCCYYVGNEFEHGHPSIIDYNAEPTGVPSLWCQWVPNDDGTAIEWDEGEKFYSYIEWIQYLITHFLAPWGYKLNGKVIWQGEDMADRGKIEIAGNVVTVTKLE